ADRRTLQGRHPAQQRGRGRSRLRLHRRPREHRPAHPGTDEEGLMELELKGKTALITGASMGIGRGIAKALAKEGVRLAVVARRRNLLEELQKEIATGLVIIEQDFLQEGAPQKIAQAALAGLGSVDILVNNAGGSRRFTLESTEAQ